MPRGDSILVGGPHILNWKWRWWAVIGAWAGIGTNTVLIVSYIVDLQNDALWKRKVSKIWTWVFLTTVMWQCTNIVPFSSHSSEFLRSTIYLLVEGLIIDTFWCLADLGMLWQHLKTLQRWYITDIKIQYDRKAVCVMCVTYSWIFFLLFTQVDLVLDRFGRHCYSFISLHGIYLVCSQNLAPSATTWPAKHPNWLWALSYATVTNAPAQSILISYNFFSKIDAELTIEGKYKRTLHEIEGIKRSPC